MVILHCKHLAVYKGCVDIAVGNCPTCGKAVGSMVSSRSLITCNRYVYGWKDEKFFEFRIRKGFVAYRWTDFQE